MHLPDVDQDSYTQYQSDQFAQQNQHRINALNFGQNNMARIAGLNSLVTAPQITLPQLPTLPQMPSPMPSPAPQPVPLPAPLPQPEPAPPPGPGPQVTAPTQQPVITTVGATPRPLGEPEPLPPEVPAAGLTLPGPPPPPGAPPGPPPSAAGPAQPVFAEPATPAGGDLRTYARQAAQRAGIDPDIFTRQIQQESGFDPNAGSPAGAQGVAQIVPSAHPGVDTSDPYASLDYAANLDRQHLDRYGGDWTKALAAYNAGAGAVDKYGGVPPYAETQAYVQKILPGGGPDQTGVPTQAASTAMSTSQFGDAQLSTDEAYAACGPAAAVRFAQAYGRNPTLREATDLAAQVGWSPGQGMAGIASEQQLMSKLGVPTKLVGSDIGQIAAEAQTGNPVTISTPGHYFYADGYNPQTGAFHVGRSGLDLRSGSEWMTPAQMTNLMGPIQGALFADNPQAPAPSTAHEPVNYLDQVRNRAMTALGAPPPPQAVPSIQYQTSTDPAVQSLDQAVETAHTSARTSAREQDGLASWRALGSQVAQPGVPGVAAESSNNPLAELGNTIAGAIQRALSGVLGGMGPPGGPGGDQRRQEDQDRQDQFSADLGNLGTLDLNPPSVGERAGEMIGRLGANPVTGQEDTLAQATGLYSRPPSSIQEAADRAMADIQRRGMPFVGPAGTLAILQPGRSLRELNPFSKGVEGSALEEVLSNAPALLGGIGHAAEEINPLRSVAADVGRAAEGSRAAQLARLAAGIGDDTSHLLSPEGRLLPGDTVGSFFPDAAAITSPRTETERNALQRLSDWYSVNFSDSNVSLNQLQEQAQKELGRPLEAPEMAAFLNRLTPGGASHIMVEQGLGPAIRDAGDDYQYLQDIIRARRMVSTSEGLGRQETARLADMPIPRAISNQVDQAERLVAQRQRDYDRVQRAMTSSTEMPGIGVPTQQHLDAAARRVRSAEDILARRQGRAETVSQAVLERAGQRGAEVANTRLFSGGLTRDDAKAILDNMQTLLGKERFNKLNSSADQVFDFSRQLKNRLVESRVMSPQLAAELDATFPDWAKTRTLDYMRSNESGRGMAAGSRLGLNDRNLRSYTLEGSARATEDPINSMVAYADQVERMARKNEAAHSILRLDQASANPRLKEVVSPSEYNDLQNAGADMTRYTTEVEPGQLPLNVFDGDTKRQLVTDDPYLREAINGVERANLPDWARAPSDWIRMATTARNPLFLARNPILDIPQYMVRTTAAGGARGPLELPMVAANLIRGYEDAFRGLNPYTTTGGKLGGILGAASSGATAALTTSQDDPNRNTKIMLAALGGGLGGGIAGGREAMTGRFEGPLTQRYLLGGGGMAGQYRAFSEADAARRVADLRRSNVFEIKGPDDLKRLMTGLMRFRWVESLGQRLELGPRVGASITEEARGLARGDSPATARLRGTLAGRDVTVDFDRGGRIVKFLNQWMPFLNASFQGSAQLVRLIREHPAGAASALGTLVVAPTIATEAWNNADPQRARDYADVPQYLKDSGIVLMLPFEPTVDKDGNRHPQYLYINMRELAPVVQASREAARVAAGRGSTEDWRQVAGSMMMSASPIQARSPEDLASRFVGAVPAESVLEVAANRDFYRGGPVMSQRADENASPLAHGLTPALQRVADVAAPGSTVRPSAVDYLMRSNLGGYGDMAIGGSRALYGEPRGTGAGETPILGGLAGSFVRGAGGQLLTTAREETLSPSARQALRDAGVAWQPSQVTSNIGKVPLRYEEQTRLQELTNRYIDDSVQRAVRTSMWQNGKTTTKERLVKYVTGIARQRAQNEVLRSIPASSRTARVRSGSSAA